MIKTERLKSVHSKKSPETCFFKYLFILLIFFLSIGATHGFAENISGYVYTSSGSGIDGVTITFSNGEESTETNSSGYYKEKVKKGWSGTATPSKNGYSFSPASRSYSKVRTDQKNQDYTGTQAQQNRTISGYVRTSSGNAFSGVTVTFDNGGGTDTTNSSGYYSREVRYGWSGTVTPAREGYSFVPVSRSYNNVTANQSNQDYTENAGDTLLSITTNIVGSGNVEIDPDKDYYAKGSLITMTATAHSGWLFSEWNGELDSPDNPERISINSDMTITAVFLADDDNDGDGDNSYGCFIGGLLFQ